MEATTLHKLAAYLERHEEGIAVGDRAGVVEWANDAWTRITGYSLGRLISKPIGSVLAEAGIDPELVDFVAQRFAAGTSSTLEFPLDRPDGRPVWLHLEVRPISRAGGEPTDFVAWARDITDRKLAEQKLPAPATNSEAGILATPAGASSFDLAAIATQLAAHAGELAGPLTCIDLELCEPAAIVSGSAGLFDAILTQFVSQLVCSFDEQSWRQLYIGCGPVRRRIGEHEWRDEGRCFIEIEADDAPPESAFALTLAALRAAAEASGGVCRASSASGQCTRLRLELPAGPDPERD